MNNPAIREVAFTCTRSHKARPISISKTIIISETSTPQSQMADIGNTLEFRTKAEEDPLFTISREDLPYFISIMQSFV